MIFKLAIENIKWQLPDDGNGEPFSTGSLTISDLISSRPRGGTLVTSYTLVDSTIIVIGKQRSVEFTYEGTSANFVVFSVKDKKEAHYALVINTDE